MRIETETPLTFFSAVQTSERIERLESGSHSSLLRHFCLMGEIHSSVKIQQLIMCRCNETSLRNQSQRGPYRAQETLTLIGWKSRAFNIPSFTLTPECQWRKARERKERFYSFDSIAYIKKKILLIRNDYEAEPNRCNLTGDDVKIFGGSGDTRKRFNVGERKREICTSLPHSGGV